MRKYLFGYYAEKNDECHDQETVIEAEDIDEAIKLFKRQVRVRKRITLISEMVTKEMIVELCGNPDPAVHYRHCYQGEYSHSCKYGEKDCPNKKIF